MKRDNTTTRRYLSDAGVKQGMHVIEIGCGGGEVTEVLAELVGSSGAVVAIDHNQNALATAQARMRERGIEYVQFIFADITGDLSSLEGFQQEGFDILAGRRVLMYLQDPAEVLRRLARWLRPGGWVVFEESDLTMVPGRTSSLAAHDQAMEWLRRMLTMEGANTAMGFGLPTTLIKAGLRFEGIRAEAVIQGQGTQYPLATLLKLMEVRVISAGIATQEEVNSLVARLDVESRDPAWVYVSDISFCAWGQKP